MVSQRLDDAVRDLYASSGLTQRPDVWRTIRTYLLQTAEAESRGGDASEIADKALVSLYYQAHRGPPSPDRPAAYLRTMVRNLVVDEQRRLSRHETLSEAVADQPSESRSHSDRVVDELLVSAGLDAALRSNDSRAVHVLTAYLDLADEQSGSISDRKVAERAGVSHPTVKTVYERFAQWALTGNWPLTFQTRGQDRLPSDER